MVCLEQRAPKAEMFSENQMGYRTQGVPFSLHGFVAVKERDRAYCQQGPKQALMHHQSCCVCSKTYVRLVVNTSNVLAYCTVSGWLSR